jgi:DNA repair protein RecN (Recombination protein N)
VLTGETGAGKSIILDALGLATGARADAGLVRARRQAGQRPPPSSPAPDTRLGACSSERGLAYERDEDLVLRRQLAADGRSRAFVNDQPAGVAALGDRRPAARGARPARDRRPAGPRTHRALLDAYGGVSGRQRTAWSGWRRGRLKTAERTARPQAANAEAEIEELTLRTGPTSTASTRAKTRRPPWPASGPPGRRREGRWPTSTTPATPWAGTAPPEAVGRPSAPLERARERAGRRAPAADTPCRSAPGRRRRSCRPRGHARSARPSPASTRRPGLRLRSRPPRQGRGAAVRPARHGPQAERSSVDSLPAVRAASPRTLRADRGRAEAMKRRRSAPPPPARGLWPPPPPVDLRAARPPATGWPPRSMGELAPLKLERPASASASSR